MAIGVIGILARALPYASSLRKADKGNVVESSRLTINTSYETPTPGPTPTLPSWAPSNLSDFQGADECSSIAECAELAPVVAEVEVIRIDPPRFNTNNGALPTEDPSHSSAGLSIFSPVVLRIVRYWKGSDEGMNGYIVSEKGGTLIGFTHSVEPGPIFRANGRGVAFLFPNTRDELQHVPTLTPTIQQLQDVADEYGQDYEQAEVIDFYEYEGDSVNSVIQAIFNGFEWIPRMLPINQFEEELNDALDQ